MPLYMRIGQAARLTPRRTRCRSARSGRTRSRSTCATSTRASTPATEVTPEALGEGPARTNTQGREGARRGELTKKLAVTVHAFSATAREKIEAAGGSADPPPASRRSRKKKKQGEAAAAEEPRPRPPRADEPSPRRAPRPTPKAEEELDCSPGSPTRGASRSSGSRVLFTAMILALYRLGSWIPAPGVNSEPIQNYFNGQRRHDPRPAEPLLGRRALALLDLRARDHAVHHGLDHPAADDRGDPEARELQKEGESGYAKINQYTRYLTVVLAAAQSTGYAFLFQRQGALHANPGRIVADHPHADRRLDPADVDGRADHQARHRQRHLAPDLRLDPHLAPAGHHRLVERRRRSRSCSSR